MSVNGQGFTADESQDLELPGVHRAANEASLRGQLRYVRLSALRLSALLVAAVAGAVHIVGVTLDVLGAVMLAGFAAAAFAEFALIWFQPERDWYAGRAVAESVKTLAWRFAVQGEPFGPSIDLEAAKGLLRERTRAVVARGRDRVRLEVGEAVTTAAMVSLRRQPFETRRASYVAFRTRAQWRWYADKAHFNEVRATRWRFGLLGGELLAVVLSAVAVGRDRPADFAGIAAAVVASAAAWLGLKQYSQLTSAYRAAAAELGIQADGLLSVGEPDWPQAVADSEEAISREHTMWLASRGEAL